MIKEVNLDYINEVIENKDDYVDELVFAFNNDIYIACDNTNGYCIIEEFETKEEVLNWLNNKWE